PFYCTRVHVLFDAGDVPALGHRTYKVSWTARREYPYPHDDWDAPRLAAGDMLTGPRSAANDRLALSVNPDGSFAVTEHASGRRYDRLDTLLDAGDRGNMWMADTPDQDAVITSEGRPAEIACLRHGPLEVIFEVRRTLSVPARYDRAAQRRSRERVDLGVVTRLRLRKHSRCVDVETTLDNTARDHVVKVCFPTGLTAKTTCADGSFSVTEYAATPDLSYELARHPVQLWFDLHDPGARAGLAVLSRATKDYEVLQEAGTCTAAMGLLRGVPLRIPCDNRLWMEYPGDESSQSLGRTTHHYAVLPHTRPWHEDHLYRDAAAFNQPLKAVQFAPQTGVLPPVFSFLEIGDPNLVLSAVLKDADRDSVLVRVFNPTGGTIQTTLTAGFDFAGAHAVSLAGERTAGLEYDGRAVRLEVGRGRIMTVELAR
ncbi:MAG: hypothetical protein JW951_02480, partial [Lentisphaerae bacterium]|nr:hypothetical protein [Lentisphaerota bacterium]